MQQIEKASKVTHTETLHGPLGPSFYLLLGIYCITHGISVGEHTSHYRFAGRQPSFEVRMTQRTYERPSSGPLCTTAHKCHTQEVNTNEISLFSNINQLKSHDSVTSTSAMVSVSCYQISGQNSSKSSKQQHSMMRKLYCMFQQK